MLTKRKKQDKWLTQAQFDALQTLEDGVVYHITDAKVDYSTEVSNRPILKTDNTTAQSTSASETITGTINLHKVAKTGTYTDLLSKPTLGTAAAKDAGTQNGVADLDANGKVPFNELPLDAKTGASAPTTSTAADYVGQWYLDTSNNKTYQCTAITSDGATPPTYTYTWVQMIRITDTATTSDYGIVKIAQGRGLDFLGDGGLYVDVAGDAQITNRTIGRPIAAASLNFAVKSALTDTNHLTMTSAEQTTAQDVLDVAAKDAGNLSSANITSWKTALDVYPNATKIYDGTALDAVNQVAWLTDSMLNYKYIIITCYYNSGDNYYFNQIIPTSLIQLMTSSNALLVSSGSNWVAIKYNTASSLILTGVNNAKFFTVYGVN